MAQKQQSEWQKLHDALAILARSQTVKTEEGRAIINIMQRMIEVELYGMAKTEPLKRNHE